MCTQPAPPRRDACVPCPWRRVCSLRDRAHTAARANAQPAARACVRATAQLLTSGLAPARHMAAAGHGLRRTCAAAQDAPPNTPRPLARAQGSRPLLGHEKERRQHFPLAIATFAQNLRELAFRPPYPQLLPPQAACCIRRTTAMAALAKGMTAIRWRRRKRGHAAKGARAPTAESGDAWRKQGGGMGWTSVPSEREDSFCASRGMAGRRCRRSMGCWR